MQDTISVIGLGYIGLPLAMSLCEKGFRVIGVDVDVHKIRQLELGHAYVQEDYNEYTLDDFLQKHMQQKNFLATTDIALAGKEATAYVITVGIPVQTLSGELNDGPLKQSMEQLGKVIKDGDLVLLRTTVVPGMIETQVVPVLERASGKRAGIDFHLAYAAERVAEGRAMYEFQTLDIVVGGLTEKCVAHAMSLLSRLTSGTLHVTDLRTAQLAKVVENAQRDVNLAIVNELSHLAEAHGVDLYELIRMVNTHPRVNLLMPSVGVGGFCIPNAFAYMNASMENPHQLPLFELSRNINAGVPNRIADRVARMLLQAGKSLENSTVAVLGLGMKDGSNDIRQSPALDCVHELQQIGVQVRAFDPTVEQQFAFQSDSMETCLSHVDAIVVGAWQPQFEEMDWHALMEKVNEPHILVDPRHRIRQCLSKAYVQKS